MKFLLSFIFTINAVLASHNVKLKPTFKLIKTDQIFTSFHQTDSEVMENWHLDWFEYDPKIEFVPKVSIRSGFFKENTKEPFMGNILYLQGLGDSMMNHRPLFEMLSEHGYRVITFDYMGQGGSKGTMNYTRIKDQYFPNLNIHTLAEYFWQKYRRVDKVGRDFRTIIGWSVGGLVAYEMAHRQWAQRVILIAPGLAPKSIINKNFKITMESLTNAVWPSSNDPHIEPIKPDSPFSIPMFSTNYLSIASKARRYKIAKSISGLVLLSRDDVHIHSDKSKRVILRNSKHFKISEFHNCKHELDNEIPEVSNRVKQEIIDFLSKN